MGTKGTWKMTSCINNESAILISLPSSKYRSRKEKVQNMQFEVLVNENSHGQINIHRMEQEAILFTHALVSYSELYAQQESTMLVFEPLHASYICYCNCTITNISNILLKLCDDGENSYFYENLIKAFESIKGKWIKKKKRLTRII